jgi:hypothetical protein
MSQNSQWKKQAAGLLPAIPCLEFLQSTSIDNVLRNGLASAFYRLKSGESVWLATDILSPTQLEVIIMYAHSARMEALLGQQRASWLNHNNMAGRSDLIVWGRPSAQHSLLKDNKQIGVQWVRIQSKTGQLLKPVSHQDRIARTLLCSNNHMITDLCDSLKKNATPFLQIVDLTPFGRQDEIRELLDHIESYFNNTPILLLTTATDCEIETDFIQIIAARSHHYQHWRQHSQDETFIGSHKRESQVTLIELPDSRFELPLIAIIEKHNALKEALKHYEDARKILLQPITKTINLLRHLAIPLDYYEHQLTHRRKGGIYPIIPIKEWIDKSSREQAPTGESEDIRQQLISQLNVFYQQLSEGKCGRMQALNYWLDNHVDRRKRSLIVTSSELDAKILSDTLLNQWSDSMTKGILSVVGISSVRELHKKLLNPINNALILTPLYPSSYWALSIADKTYWVGYTQEQHWMQWAYMQWQAGTQPCEAGKHEWWQLQNVKPFSLEPTIGTPPSEIWSQCSGEYPQHIEIDIDLKDDPLWYQQLLKPIKERPLDDDAPPLHGEISIKTDHDHILRLQEQEQVYILQGDEGMEVVKKKAACEVLKDDHLILINEDETMGANLYEVLFETATEDSIQWKSTQQMAEQWYTYLSEAIYKLKGVDALHKTLKQQKVHQKLETVKRWSKNLVLNPQDRAKVVPIVARLSGMNISEQDLEVTMNAQKKIHGLHSTIGKQLKQIMLSTVAPNTVIKGKSALKLDHELLRDLIDIETVTYIAHHPILQSEPKSKDTVLSLLQEAASKFSNRFKVMPTAERSATKSKFKQFSILKRMLEFVAGPLFEAYGSDKMTIDEMVKKGRAINIDFRGNSSEITMGQHKSHYFCQYNGSKIDIGKHIGYGGSRNPERCIRIHYHWDKEIEKLILHHVGDHLPTQSS